MIRTPNARCVLPSEGLRRTNGRTDTRQMHYHFPLGRSQGTRKSAQQSPSTIGRAGPPVFTQLYFTTKWQQKNRTETGLI